ncbi:GNAT family N-acetyltransferase [Rhodanobacter sp. L36]|uniref:GNAT family N-acetyltransferase n=1 Tax=Rhodanobacter sp. L36 TaxID=1747221 RepID=UPI00131CD23C|nr:GNAT family N-acetyltransferase [Rhodanobacter sp. L36]
MSLQIREATLRDINAVTVLFDGYRQFYGQPADISRARDFLAERIANRESLILLARGEGDEAALGFTQLYPLFSSVRTVRTWLLNDLFVASAARRRGVAAALINAAVDAARARGAASLSLSTALDNAPAQALYESMGWQRDRQFCEYMLTL